MAAIVEKIFHYHTKRGLRSRLLQWKKGDREADRPPFCHLYRHRPIRNDRENYNSHPTADAPNTAALEPSSALMRNFALPLKIFSTDFS